MAGTHLTSGPAPRGSTALAGDATAVPALLATALPNGAVRCDLCAHRCLVRPGRRGICGVRENRDGTLVSLVFDRIAAADLDPIEKKPFFHVLPGSRAYSIATVGCNLHCRHCQNWELSQAPRLGRAFIGAAITPDGIVERALASGARSVAYTYTEPTVFAELVLETAHLARQAGLRNLLVTNGYQTPAALDLLAPVIDAANVDLKSFSDRFYRRVCGGRLEPVLSTLAGMRERGIWLEVTTLVISGLNDDPGELADLTRWLERTLGPETPWHVSAFYPAWRMRDRPPTPARRVELAVEIGREAGLRHVYPGNLRGVPVETRCAGCGEMLIRRLGYAVVASAPDPSVCPRCARRLPGVWAPRPAREAA